MFESHLAGDGSILGELGNEGLNLNWQTSAVEKGAGILQTLSTQAIDSITGTTSTPAPSASAAVMPGPAINQVPVTSGAQTLPIVDPSRLAAASRPKVSPILIYGGLALAGIAAFFILKGGGGRPKRKSTRRRRRR